MGSSRQLNWLIFAVPFAVDGKCPAIQRTPVVRDRHGSRRVKCATRRSSRRERPAIRRCPCAVEDVKSQNVRRAVTKCRRIIARNGSARSIEGHNPHLQRAIFLVHDYWHASRIARSKGPVSCIVGGRVIRPPWKNHAVNCHGAARKRGITHTAIYRRRSDHRDISRRRARRRSYHSNGHLRRHRNAMRDWSWRRTVVNQKR